MTHATHPLVEQARTIAKDYLDSFALANPEGTAAFVARDFVNEHTAGLGTGCVGRDVYQQRLGNFLTDMAGLTYEVEHLVAQFSQHDPETVDPDTVEVAAFYTMRASWQAKAPFAIRGVQRLTVRDGLIAHRTDYWDSAVFLCQVDEEARAALAEMGITTSD